MLFARALLRASFPARSVIQHFETSFRGPLATRASRASTKLRTLTSLSGGQKISDRIPYLRWTAEQDAQLVELRDVRGLTFSAIEAHLHKKAADNRYRKLLEDGKKVPAPRSWSDAETQRLMDAVGSTPRDSRGRV
ncbi:hypothetical protein HKX48_005668 [Thoreauomyces humboldtii]|nr:hypothetical protein HKX48_005668 [Thoreauomyces humboldtii]